MNRAEVTTLVKAKIDEVTGFVSSEIDSVNLIEPLLDEASDKIRRIAPLHLIRPIEFDVSQLTILDPVVNEMIDDEGGGSPFLDPVLQNQNTKKAGVIPLPLDFLRLHSFKMKEWKTILSGDHVISSEHPKYKQQKYAHIRGGIWKPVIAILHRYGPFGARQPDPTRKVLEFYSIISNQECEVHFYIPTVAVEMNEEILMEAITWQCAADVLQVMNDFDSAKIAQEKVIQFMKENSLPLTG